MFEMNPEENKFKWSVTEDDPFLWPKESFSYNSDFVILIDNGCGIMVSLFFWNQRPTWWCLKFGSFVSCCNINETTAQCNFSWAAELEQFSDELQMVESMFSLFCLFLSHMVTSHWRGDSCWLTATVVLKQWGSGLCTPLGESSSCCSENNCARGKRSVLALWPTWEGRWLCAVLL